MCSSVQESIRKAQALSNSRFFDDDIGLVVVCRLPFPVFTGTRHPLEVRLSLLLAGLPSFKGVLKVAEPLVITVG